MQFFTKVYRVEMQLFTNYTTNRGMRSCCSELRHSKHASDLRFVNLLTVFDPCFVNLLTENRVDFVNLLT